MRLAYTLNSSADVYAKLERESYRAFHCDNPMAKADYLYNFCVTAHALRDYFFTDQNISESIQRDKHHKHWNSIPELAATGEIANTTKHFELRGGQRTIAATPADSTVVAFYSLPDGRTIHRGEQVCDIQITLSDGTTTMTYEFTKRVLDYWFRYLTSHGIPIRKQSVDDLLGT